jgi:hypothetical protein
MAEEKKLMNTYAGGAVIAALIFAVMFFFLEWLNKMLALPDNVNPVGLPKMHLVSLAVNVILSRAFIRKPEKENTAKGILIVSFLFMLAYFLFINK